MKWKPKTKIALSVIILIAMIGVVHVSSHITMNTKKLDNYIDHNLNEFPAEKWNTLSGKTIFFGHMSVGYNIIEGITDVLKEIPSAALIFQEIKTPSEASVGGFCHAALGHNGDPNAKIKAFRDFVNAMDPAPDIAFVKFCYVDFYAQTDTIAVIDAYREMIVELQKGCPETTFLHCTVPLAARPRHFMQKCKDAMKSLIGKPTTIDHNAKREEFSEWLRQTYPAESIIDVAHSEAVSEQGVLVYKTRKGKIIPFLRSDYTYDGGHLNERGRERAAKELLTRLLDHAD